MHRLDERMTSLLLACLTAMLFTLGCDDTAGSSRDAGREFVDAVDATLADTDATSTDVTLEATRDAVGDVGVGMDATVDRFDVPIPEAAACGPSADAQIMLGPEVNVPIDVYETCRTMLPVDAGPPCTPRAVEACDCADGMPGTRTCRDDLYWGSCRCGVADAGMDVPVGSGGPIPRITQPRLIAPQSGSRATSQRPTFAWVLPEGITRARVEVCADRPCARMLMTQELSGSSWRPSDRLSAGVVFWRVHGLAADGSETWTSATWEVGIRHRDLPEDTSYGVLKDFNGDGYDDAIVLSGYERRLYHLRLYPGSSSGLHADQYRGMNPPYAHGTSLFELFGGDGMAAGDVNGDGLADLVVGDYGYGTPGSEDEGRAYLYLGTRDGWLPECSQTLRPQRIWGEFGRAIGVGDFNGDGYGDTAVTCGDIAGGLQLYLGSPSGSQYLPVDSMIGLDNNVAFIGDVNRDGYEDIAALTSGSSNDTQVVILYGNPSGRLSFHQQPVHGRYIGDSYGQSISWGDYNSDGYADVLIAGLGYADVYHGSVNGLTLVTSIITPPRTSEGASYPVIAFAGHVSATGDIDGDGRQEVVVGAPLAPVEYAGGGQVFLYSSTGERLPELWTQVLAPWTTRGPFGVVAIPGDLNGDGFDDLMLGAIDRTLESTSDVYVYYGRTGEWWCGTPIMIRESGPISALGRRIQ